ncbi:hypothetical protein [Kocuria rosea]|uniref:hypothetical protein n=1 Tax=Kocuria rosea TaxID=1275 RepID=UPI00232DB54F|nr:hypothetical protein [Kocuria rosea]
MTIRRCSFPGCERQHRGRGYCDAHLQQLRKNKDLTPIRSQKPVRKCETLGCTNDHDSNGLCTKCRLAKNRAEERAQRPPFDPVEYLRERIDVDPITGCWNWTGPIDRQGYGKAHLQGTSRRAHRWAWAKIAHLELPPYPALCLDHLCENKRCVRPAHLQPTTIPANTELNRQRTALLAEAGPEYMLAVNQKPRSLDELAATVLLSPELIGFPPGASLIHY